MPKQPWTFDYKLEEASVLLGCIRVKLSNRNLFLVCPKSSTLARFPLLRSHVHIVVFLKNGRGLMGDLARRYLSPLIGFLR